MMQSKNKALNTWYSYKQGLKLHDTVTNKALKQTVQPRKGPPIHDAVNNVVLKYTRQCVMWIKHWVFSPVVLKLRLGCKTWLIDSRVVQPQMWSFKLSVALSCTDDAPRDPSLLLILKWGGELTPAGRIQAENLGKAFRTLYPGGQGEWVVNPLSVVRGLGQWSKHWLRIERLWFWFQFEQQ